MNDMSFSALEAADEFGGLDHLILPGQDPAVLYNALAGFTASLKPRDFIERLWVRDMAIETARVEYMRLASCGVHRLAEAGELDQSAAVDETGCAAHEEQQPSRESEPNETCENDQVAAGEAESSPDRTAGRILAAHFPLINDIMRLEIEFLQERDALIQRYDNRGELKKMLEDALERIQELEEAVRGL